jgi:hypothetical protein
VRSCTDCRFDWPDTFVESPRGEGGRLARFYADSQGCLFWYLYSAPHGYWCVLASPNRYTARGDGGWTGDPGAAWFCAPSFEAFVYRTWIENEIWFRLVSPQFAFHDPRPLSPEMLAYLDHYGTSQRPAS